AEMIDQREEALGRDDVDVLAGPGGFRARGLGTDDAEVACMGGDGGRQDAGGRGKAAVETELAEREMSGECVGGNGADCGHEAEGDGEVVVAAFLGEVRGREVNGDPLGREAEAGGEERRVDTLARLL